MTQSGETLAILGGDRVIPEGMIKKWPPIGDRDREMVLAALEGNVHTYGPNCHALEREFAAWNGNKHVLFCNSGTAALHMAVVACDCGAGDEVIVPAYTWPSSATCCLHHNVIPVFVDIERSTMNIDPEKIEAAITPRTRAIMVVHLHGLAADMDRIMEIAGRHKLMVIEDCCQAHGATFKGKRVGLFGHCAAFSCNQNKCLCSGEGGFFVSDDQELFEKGKTLWYFGENRPPEGSGDFHTYGMGWMYRSTELTAAFARAQLGRLDEYLEQTSTSAARLTECLQDVPNLILPCVPEGYGHNYYNYTVRFDMEALDHVDDAASFRNKLVKALTAEGAETGVWQGWPVPQMTVFQAKNAYGKGCPWKCRSAPDVDYRLEQYPVARRHADWHTGMTAPLRPPNGPQVAGRVAEAFRKIMRNIDQVQRVEA